MPQVVWEMPSSAKMLGRVAFTIDLTAFLGMSFLLYSMGMKSLLGLEDTSFERLVDTAGRLWNNDCVKLTQINDCKTIGLSESRVCAIKVLREKLACGMDFWWVERNCVHTNIHLCNALRHSFNMSSNLHHPLQSRNSKSLFSAEAFRRYISSLKKISFCILV